MADRQELEIQIAHDGTVTINVQGTRGASCLELTKDLEESLGVVLEREKKSAFYEQTEPQKIRVQEE